MDIEEVHAKAEAFVKKRFPELDHPREANNRRITVLAIMKQIIDLSSH